LQLTESTCSAASGAIKRCVSLLLMQLPTLEPRSYGTFHVIAMPLKSQFNSNGQIVVKVICDELPVGANSIATAARPTWYRCLGQWSDVSIASE
jgi:hypothetical protein